MTSIWTLTRRSVLSSCLLGLLSLGCAQSEWTQRQVVTDPGFSFIAAADMRQYTPPDHTGPQYFEGACLAIKQVGPGAFMVSPGDIDPPERVRATIDAVLGEDYPWYPAVGNHELEKPAHVKWLRAYNEGGKRLPHIVRSGPPGAEETCYSFDYGNAHVAIINQYYDGTDKYSADGNIHESLYNWLAEDLAATDKPIIFVVGHEPTVAVPDIGTGLVRHRGDSLDKYEKNNFRFWSLLRENNVTAYICGHTHVASMSKINGVWQLDAGHSRGIGDKGAPSSFLKLHVGPGEHVRCDMYRMVDDQGTYKLTYSEQLR